MDASHARVLDPRWYFITHAGDQFWEALERGDQIAGMNIVVVSEGGQTLNYAVVAGERELHRHLVTDPDAIAAAMREASVDLTPEGGAA